MSDEKKPIGGGSKKSVEKRDQNKVLKHSDGRVIKEGVYKPKGQLDTSNPPSGSDKPSE